MCGVRGRAATAAGVEGSGFGLSIASQLVALLGGALELTNARMPEWAWREASAAAAEEDGRAAAERPEGVSAQIWLPRAKPIG